MLGIPILPNAFNQGFSFENVLLIIYLTLVTLFDFCLALCFSMKLNISFASNQRLSDICFTFKILCVTFFSYKFKGLVLQLLFRW